jgi:hypothetical protein
LAAFRGPLPEDPRFKRRQTRIRAAVAGTAAAGLAVGVAGAMGAFNPPAPSTPNPAEPTPSETVTPDTPPVAPSPE